MNWEKIIIEQVQVKNTWVQLPLGDTQVEIYKDRAALLKLECACESPQEAVKMQILTQ